MATANVTILLRWCRLEAILEPQGVANAIEDSDEQFSPRNEGFPALNVDRRKTSSIIVNRLENKPLRIVQMVQKDLKETTKNLDERYASSSLASRMELMWELKSVTFEKKEDVADFIDSYSTALDHLASTNAKIDNDLSVIIQLSPMDGNFESKIEALRRPDQSSWDYLCARLIGVSKSAKMSQNEGIF